MGRTDSMPEARGLNKLIRPLRYHEASRQWFAILFVPLVSYFGQPNRELLVAGSIVAIIGALIRPFFFLGGASPICVFLATLFRK